MADLHGAIAERLALVDAVDHLLSKGAVLTGETVISLAGVDLVYLGLNVVLASVETLRRDGGAEINPPPGPLREGKESRHAPLLPVSPEAGTEQWPGLGETAGVGSPSLKGGGRGVGLPSATAAALPRSSPLLYPDTQTRGAASSPSEPAPPVTPLAGLPERLAAGTDDRPERGLARLVLTLIELLRQIVERQALRRVEGEGLSDEQVERMGIALMELEAKMAELRDAFGLSEEDVNLDLGPLGRLL